MSLRAMELSRSEAVAVIVGMAIAPAIEIVLITFFTNGGMFLIMLISDGISSSSGFIGVVDEISPTGTVSVVVDVMTSVVVEGGVTDIVLVGVEVGVITTIVLVGVEVEVGIIIMSLVGEVSGGVLVAFFMSDKMVLTFNVKYDELRKLVEEPNMNI